jgi:hypothetical protein
MDPPGEGAKLTIGCGILVLLRAARLSMGTTGEPMMGGKRVLLLPSWDECPCMPSPCELDSCPMMVEFVRALSAAKLLSVMP